MKNFYTLIEDIIPSNAIFNGNTILQIVGRSLSNTTKIKTKIGGGRSCNADDPDSVALSRKNNILNFRRSYFCKVSSPAPSIRQPEGQVQVEIRSKSGNGSTSQQNQIDFRIVEPIVSEIEPRQMLRIGTV